MYFAFDGISIRSRGLFRVSISLIFSYQPLKITCRKMRFLYLHLLVIYYESTYYVLSIHNFFDSFMDMEFFHIIHSLLPVVTLAVYGYTHYIRFFLMSVGFH